MNIAIKSYLVYGIDITEWYEINADDLPFNFDDEGFEDKVKESFEEVNELKLKGCTVKFFDPMRGMRCFIVSAKQDEQAVELYDGDVLCNVHALGKVPAVIAVGKKLLAESEEFTIDDVVAVHFIQEVVM